MKRNILLLLVALLPVVANAYNTEINGIYYNFSGNEAIVTYYNNNYNSYSGDVVIPESVTYNGTNYNVTSIGVRAFSNCSNLTSVTIPESVTSIGNYTFCGCSGLTTITIPEGATSIGEYAFEGCSSLTSITIGSSVASIGKYAFQRCSNITTVTLESNTIVSSSSSMSSIFGNQVKEYIIGNNVTRIGSKAFDGCSSLTTITIGNGVTSIGSSAFSGCTSLTSVHITDLTTWNNISYAGATSQPLYYAHHLYLNDQEITGEYVIPEYLSHIGEYAFCGCTGLTSVTIPENIKYIGGFAFYDCPRLRHIYVSSPIPTDFVSYRAFYCDSGVKDPYDVYNYAILHVPMGSKEEYAAAYEWRYFNKIKEDLDINGQVFYTTLSVNQAGDGYVKHYVKADEPYTLFIGSEVGMRINTILFNGEDVTDRLVDGYYTTPNIIRPSKIVVSFEQDPDGISYAPANDNLHVYGNEGSLYVSGLEKSQRMAVYTLDGKLTSTQTIEGDTKLKLSEGIYIIKVGERTFKVQL